MSLTVQTKLLIVLLLQNVDIGNIFVCVLILRVNQTGIFSFFQN